MAEKSMWGKEMQVIARKEKMGDVTVIESGYSGDGSLMVSEEVSGPSASVAYGEPRHKLQIVFAPEVIGCLASALGAGAEMNSRLHSYFDSGEHALVDLMDLCDAHRVSYSYQSLGSATGVTYRPVSGGC
ncbi:hypothetical protein [Olsenella sp. Marseille-P4559]|uniref:hypothetical protein n=1 Tax=Olsenella sp. Marseille-P4559 TaxID=2364795 RepID=UPI001031A4E8|nr:hypothetical protein [Olsenella sp. Marseille-P4559]